MSCIEKSVLAARLHMRICDCPRYLYPCHTFRCETHPEVKRTQYFLPVMFIWSLVYVITNTVVTNNPFWENQGKTKVMVTLQS